MQQQNNNTSAAGEDDDDMSANNFHRSSALEFKLRRLKYIGMLSSGDRTGAIAYARCHFPSFVGSHEREVQSLMGAVMYANGDDPRSRLLSSPYGKMRIEDVHTLSSNWVGLSKFCGKQWESRYKFYT